MNRFLGSVALAFSLATIPPGAQAKPSAKRAAPAIDPDFRAAVELRLRSQDVAPTADTFQSLGPDVDNALVLIAGDPKADVLLRARAVSALAYFPSAVSRQFLEGTIDAKSGSGDKGDRLLVRKAAVALGWHGGPGAPARLGPLLANPDPEVRVDAAIGLGLTRLPRAAALLKSRFDVETDPRVRSQIGRQLRAIEASAGTR